VDSVRFGLDFISVINEVPDVDEKGDPGVRATIKQRCRDCYEEAARQVRSFF
jgi:hypothetical protein